ncbi:MAG TPA: hypothetical protein VN751_05225 [Solirubrobacteraceae bacterium]|jgi:hypothetical protein|nr:hypothetical protein [Solirubrobacteraceae bacterium]
MARSALDVYLNDHLGGSTFGLELAKQIRDRSKGTALGQVMTTIVAEIEEDRETLLALMEQLGTQKSALKQAVTWVAEKASRVKFSGATSGGSEVGRFLALETLMLGITGKLALWTALAEIAAEHPPLQSADLDRLIARARSQRDVLEAERLAAARRVLAR